MGYSEKHLNLVSFDIPYPPDYGGVIDVFYKIKALHAQGVKVHLYCFQYGRPESKMLAKYCESVSYYPRHVSKTALFRKVPYIVASRTSDQLTSDLAKNDYPILLEGLHCCGLVGSSVLAGRKIFVRTHNVEHEYYRHLAEAEKQLFKRIYFYQEAAKLESFEPILNNVTGIFAISTADVTHFSKLNPNTRHLPPFHPNEQATGEPGSGKFALYHGNLGIGENNKAALFLVNEVFLNSAIPIVIAGSRPSGSLRTAVANASNATLKADISSEEVMQLVKEAHVNILPTFQATGIKLKLLAALYNGRHVVVNPTMVEGTGLEALCHIANTTDNMRTVTERLFQTPFTAEEIQNRNRVLEAVYSNRQNGALLITSIFG